MAAQKRRATDHRAIVMESVITYPGAPTLEEIVTECVAALPTLNRHKADAMVRQLRTEHLLGVNESGGHYLTDAGLDYFKAGVFDRALPKDHERPKSRKRKQ